jgi:hypothetical protein
MGFIKDKKVDRLTSDAQQAWADQTRMSFTPILNVSWSNAGMSGDVSDIGMMMDAIGRVGWRLHTWAVTSDKNGHPQAMPLFIR